MTVLRLSVSRQLYYVAALVLVLVAGVAAQQLWQVRRSKLQETERQMARLDMVFAEQTGRAVESVDLILRDTVFSAQRMQMGAHSPEELSGILRRRIAGVRQVADLLIVDKNGQVAAAANVQGPMPPLLGAALATYLKTPPEGLQFSLPFKLADGTWSALMVRAIVSDTGQWLGLAVACLNLGYFEDFYKAVELSENGAIVLHRRDGTVLARFPHNDAVVGTSFAELPPFRDVLSKAQAGTVIMTSPVDGSTRVLAIRALKAFPLAVNVSVDMDMILAQWRVQVFLLGGAALIASAIVTALLLMLAQRSRQIEVLVGEFRAARDSAELASARLREQMDERERAEAALRQAQRIEVIGQLTGGVAHDFNNLLTVVLGNLDVLQRTHDLPPGPASLLNTIRSAAERGAALTSQLLAFARRQPLVASPVEVSAVLHQMSDLLLSALGSRISMQMQVAGDLWPAMIDPTQVELLVLNLAINARDAMPDGGTLIIAASNITLGASERAEQQPGDYVRLVVSDTGMGMTQEVQSKAFEPFFTTKGPGRGSGLGLSQVYGVVRQSGGGVQIASQPGRGTSVIVYLPRAAPALAMAPPPQSPGLPGRRIGSDVTVLLVDDDPAVRSTTAQLLRHLGYTVAEADSGAAAIGLLQAGPVPDVVLTDVAMPGMSGPELARRLQRDWPKLPVVFVSGYADPQSVAGGGQMKRLVSKPFRPAELAAQLEAALSEQRAGV